MDDITSSSFNKCRINVFYIVCLKFSVIFLSMLSKKTSKSNYKYQTAILKQFMLYIIRYLYPIFMAYLYAIFRLKIYTEIVI